MRDQRDLELIAVTKHYGTVTAVDNLALAVERGEFLALLGPSGCGKTTTLRLVAGLLAADAGRILIRGTDVGNLPTFKRNIGMVFQNYALFPHMTIAENVRFGLLMRRFDPGTVSRRVAEMLRLARLEGLGSRYPRQLSGGQQQRVALARALAIEPHLLLLDEPLSNLDLKLRQEMRLELRAIQRDLGITTILVTHDQEEALVMADRIAVMRQGRLEQIGTPKEIYYNPRSRFVAGFLGESNFLTVHIEQHRDDGTALVRVPSGEIVGGRVAATIEPGASTVLAIRPERVRLGGNGPPRKNRLSGTLAEVVFSGSLTRYYVNLSGGETWVVEEQSAGDAEFVARSGPVTIEWDQDDGLILA